MKRKWVTIIILSLFIIQVFPLYNIACFYQNEKSGTEIFGVGLYEYELLNVYRILGNEEEFFLQEGLSTGWSGEGTLRLYLDGLIFHDWQLTLSYDSTPKEETERLWAKLGWGASYLFYGGHQLSFPNYRFIGGNYSLYGPELHLEGEKNLFTGSFVELKGRFAREEIAADGSSIYFLKFAPIVGGSEIIYLQTRDPISGAVISQTRMKRDIDYTIDNDSGEITFAKAIASTTPQGNLNYIVVDYQYPSEAPPGYQSYLAGLQDTYNISDRLSLRVGYLTQYDDKGSSTLELAGRNPSQNSVLSVGTQYKITEDLLINTEYGRSQQDQDSLTPGNEVESSAYRAELKGKLTNRSKILLAYERVEPEFFSFDPELEDDLEKYQISLSHQLTDKLTLKGGYEYSYDNILKEEQATTTKETTDLGFAYKLGKHKYLGQIELEGLYQLKDEENDWYPQEGSQSKVSSLTLNLTPSEVLNSFLKYEHEDIYAKPELEMTSKKDTAIVGLEYAPAEKRSLAAQVQLIKEEDLLTGETPSTKKFIFQGKRDLTSSLDTSFNYEHSDTEIDKEPQEESNVISAEVKYNPSERLAISLGGEVSRKEDYTPDPPALQEKKKVTVGIEYYLSSYSLLEAEYQREVEVTSNPQSSKLSEKVAVKLPYQPSPQFSLTPGYEYERLQETLPQESLEVKSTPSLKIDWYPNEKWELFSNLELKIADSILPPPEVKELTATGLGRITYKISDQWELMGQYEGNIQIEPEKSDKQTINLELGREITKNIWIRLGYQNIKFSDGAIPENDYQADMPYIRLTGKF